MIQMESLLFGLRRIVVQMRRGAIAQTFCLAACRRIKLAACQIMFHHLRQV